MLTRAEETTRLHSDTVRRAEVEQRLLLPASGAAATELRVETRTKIHLTFSKQFLNLQ